MAPDPKLNVLFLLQRAEGWTNLRAIWRRMAVDPRFQPEVWVLPYDVRRPAELAARQAVTSAALKAESVPHALWTSEQLLEPNQFDVVVFNTPYDVERPAQLHFDVVARQVPVTAYVPYGFVVGGGRKNQRLQYSQPAQMHSTLVFARSWRERAMYRRHCPTGDAHVRVTGLPRLDDLAAAHPAAVDGELAAAVGGRFAVLWNSHFSIGERHRGSLDYSTFDRLGAELIEYAAGNPDVALIWRPHPLLLPTLEREGILSHSDFASLERDLRRADIVLDRRTDHRPAFAASSALLTDAGSFLFEYVLTGKPMAYLHNPDGPGLTEEAEELVARLETVIDARGAIEFIERARLGNTAEAMDLAGLRGTFLPMQDGKSAHRIVESIAAAATAARRGHDRATLEADAYPCLSRLNASLRERRAAVEAKPRGLRLLRSAWNSMRDAGIEALKRRPAIYRSLTRRRR
jgi:hypothetical protein